MSDNALALDPQGLDSLRWQAKQNGGKDSVRAAAQQFEAYFVQMMLHSMRATLSQDGPFDSQETRTFGDMLDQQMALGIAKGKGIGLADKLVAQIEASLEAKPGIKLSPRPYNLPSVAPQDSNTSLASATESSGVALTPRNFVDKLWPHAANAAAELGVSPHFLLAQAALETGWGKHELRGAEGNSYNLFNIKAGKNWSGATVGADATEYVNGKAVQQTASFRAYDSYAAAFADYVRLLKDNPRYAGAVAQGNDAESFARGLQSGGYASDPAYADKILRIINSTPFREGLAARTADVRTS